jgi:hypothetical protein
LRSISSSITPRPGTLRHLSPSPSV